MKRGFQKSLALVLAMFMAFGAMPFFAVSLIAYAGDPTLVSITLSVDETLSMVAGEFKDLSVVATYSDTTSKFIDAKVIAWSTSDSSLVEITSEGKLSAIAPTKEGKPVSIKAYYTEGSVTVFSECKVTVIKAPVYVDTILWNWSKSAFLAGDDTEYSFAYVDKATDPEQFENNLYKIIPDNADKTSATLKCTPEGALQIDNVKKTFKINPITTEKLVITLTLTADGASEKCNEATKQITVYDDVPITGVRWTYAKGSTNLSGFSYYEKKDGNVTSQVAVYYYRPTEAGDKKAPYKYETIPANDDFRDLLEWTVTSADKRVVIFDETTGRLIPVGNGQATITLTGKSPKGRIYKDEAVIVVVSNSPYTPITSVSIGYDAKNTDSDAEYDSKTNTIKLMNTHSIQFTANLNSGAKLDQKAISMMLDDGRKITIVKATECTWSSSDPSVATVDENGKVTVTGPGDAVITLSINDNGVTINKEINIHGTMPWWQALVSFFMCLFSGKWNKIPTYLKAFFVGLLGSII